MHVLLWAAPVVSAVELAVTATQQWKVAQEHMALLISEPQHFMLHVTDCWIVQAC